MNTDHHEPQPVVDPNPPRRRRTPPPDDGNSVAHTTRTSGVTATVTNGATNVGNEVPHQVPAGGPSAALSIDALLYGRTDPDQDRAQTGVRLPKYVTDTVRAVSVASRGKLSMQDIVTNAVKAYLPDDALRAAWLRHGGDPGDQQ